jgi:GxxExxY protein
MKFVSCHELSLNGLKIERQKAIPIFYRGIKLDGEYRLDLIVEDQVIVEIKAVSELLPVHEAQFLS